MAWTLCSKEDVQALIPITEANLLDNWSDFVEGLIAQHMGVPGLGATVVYTDEYYNGDGTDILVVNHPPIVSVSSLEVEDEALSSSEYEIFRNSIQLKNDLLFTAGRLNVKVSYTGGIAGTDPVISLAAATMVAAIWNYSQRHGSDGSIKWAVDNSMKAGETSPVRMTGLVSHLNSIMRGFLRREKVRIK